MAEPTVYLEKLSLFSRALRKEGLLVSPMETADASQILISLGLEDREQVKTALRTVYAKSREEQASFDRVFDDFFVSEEIMKKRAEEMARQQTEMEQRRQEANEDLESMGFDDAQRDAYAAMAEDQKKRLRDIKEKYKGNPDRSSQLYGNFIHSVFAKAILEQQLLMENAGSDCEGLDPEVGLLYRDISQFQDQEIPKAISIIQTVTRQINGELSAKRKHSGHSGKLDYRRTIRKGLETGRSLYRLRYRKKRQRRRHLVLLCDVSGSMMQFSEFALRFIQSLNQVSDSSRAFLFSEDLFEADAFSLQNMDLFRNYVRESGLYGRGTDLGTALEKLCAIRPAVLGPAATLLILSDTKTIDQPRSIAALKEAQRQAGKVIWLNPIPQSKWPYVRSIQTMAALVPMVSCSTLRELAAACRRLAQN